MEDAMSSELEQLEKRVPEIEALAIEHGLSFFPTGFEVVPQDIMTEIAAYGLPTRARHWSYGKVYQSQRLYGNMGLSKIYEIVLNGNPALAFLLDSNDVVSNLLVAAHVFAHVDFFKNNALFKDTNRHMVNDAAARAIRVDQYIERYGLNTVENMQDIGFALDRHVDVHRGTDRQKYPERHVVEKERFVQPYEDLYPNAGMSVTYQVEGERFPPHAEHDLLWFLKTYAPIEDWQKDVLTIIREESYYFYPQFLTKILNEGWASYWHAELFHHYNNVSPEEMIQFARTHSSVVNPGGRFNLNPYYLGYTILVDIEKRWDEMHETWSEDPRERERLRKKGEYVSEIRPPKGRDKLFEVRTAEDDISFIRNYLTPELVEKLGLFAHGSNCTHPPGQKCPQCEYIVITSRDCDAVIEQILTPRYNYGVPRIVIRDVVNGTLYLEHLDRGVAFLDRKFASETLSYIVKLWKNSVHLLTSDEHGRECNLTSKAT